jgi:hypothetical protein
MGFRELPNLRRRYFGQAGDLVNAFYIPVLSEAVSYDRQAGYFDSASLVMPASPPSSVTSRSSALRPVRRCG